MAVQKMILIDHNQKEQIDPENEGFLYQINEVCFGRYFWGNVPYHWHTFLEFSYVKDGSIEYSFAENKMILKEGDALFINSNVLHSSRPVSKNKKATAVDILFDHRFLCGSYNSTLERTYFLPLMANASLPFYMFPGGEPLTGELIETFDAAVAADRERAFGYEFTVQSQMAKLWLKILNELNPLLQKKNSKTSVSITRMKAMLLFISEHYTEKITLDDIAASATISRRECCRCFHAVLSVTPTNYLTQYRLDAAIQLLANTSKSVLEISEACGFSSAGYFSKVFRSYTGQTPKDFRKGIVG